MARLRGLCIHCGVNPQEPMRKKGRRTSYRKLCASCYSKRSKKKYNKEYKRMDSCEACGETPKIPQLLQLDHIDGDRDNNSLKNYWTLCVTCHQIKSIIESKNRQILGLSNRISELEDKIFEKEKTV